MSSNISIKIYNFGSHCDVILEGSDEAVKYTHYSYLNYGLTTFELEPITNKSWRCLIYKENINSYCKLSAKQKIFGETKQFKGTRQKIKEETEKRLAEFSIHEQYVSAPPPTYKRYFNSILVERNIRAPALLPEEEESGISD